MVDDHLGLRAAREQRAQARDRGRVDAAKEEDA
jgi:hypothetical protein